MKTLGQVRSGVVVTHFRTGRDIADFPDIAHELRELPDDVQDGWLYDEVTGECGPVQVGPVEIQAALVVEAQRRLDAFALARGYDDIKSLVTYADDPDQTFAAEGLIGKQKRSAMWAALRDYKDLVLAGEAPMPQSIDDIPGLPDLTW